MSWDWDPFRHAEFGTSAENHVVLYCGNCGMEKDIGPVETMTVKELLGRWHNHVVRSHRMTPADTKTYSAPGKRFIPGPPLDTCVLKLDGAGGPREEVWGHYG